MSTEKKVRTRETGLLKMASRVLGHKSVDEMLEKATFDFNNQCPGVCLNCRTPVEDCEPDSDANICDNCGAKKVASVLILANLI